MTHNTLRAAAEAARDTLESAKAGIEWWCDMLPEHSNGSDDEMLAQIDAAVAGLNAVLSQEPPAAAPAQGERAAFEAAWKVRPVPGLPEGVFASTKETAWAFWQMRARRGTYVAPDLQKLVDDFDQAWVDAERWRFVTSHYAEDHTDLAVCKNRAAAFGETANRLVDDAIEASREGLT
jgi:hypothetical protein